MRNIFFSVIIPVYNVESYLKECVDSVLAQSIDSFEILLIDDGSTDNSGMICNDYGKKYDFVKVIHQQNQGLSAARNTGIDCAVGRYILFLDSDDYIATNALEKIYEILSKKIDCDIIHAYSFKVEEDGEIHLELPTQYCNVNGETGIEAYNKMASLGALIACAPHNICRREFVLDNKLYFAASILHEDELWMPLAMFKAQKVVCLDFCFYYHRMREGSIIQTGFHTKNGLHILKICNALENFSKQYPKKKTIWLRNSIASNYMNGVFVGDLSGKKDLTLDRWFPLRNAHTTKNILKAIIFAFSPRIYCKVDSWTK